MNNADTLNLSWTKVKQKSKAKTPNFTRRQPTDPDHLSEHRRAAPDTHRLAQSAQEQGSLLRQEGGRASAR